MVRINDLSTPMNLVGSWALVKVRMEDEIFLGVIARTSVSYFCFASNNPRLEGCSQFLSSFDSIIASYRKAWTINAATCGDFTLGQVISRHTFNITRNIELVCVIHENGERVYNPVCHVVDSVEEDESSDVAFINKKYKTTSIYTGVHAYHYHHGIEYNKPVNQCSCYKIGVELEVEFKRSADKSYWNENVKSNWFFCERDGSLNENGVEIITIPMNPKDIKSRSTWEPIVNYLASKAKSWDSPRCGLHIHIGREILGSNPEQQSETIGKLLYLYHQFLNNTPMNTSIFGRARAYNDRDGKTPESDAIKVLGSDVLRMKTIKETLKKAMIDKTSENRYFDINLLNEKTIEFRKGRGSINVSRIIKVVEYCEIMCKYAKRTKWYDINRENFIEYASKNIKGDSPLYVHFEQGENCDCD